jgi:hypothetical protein
MSAELRRLLQRAAAGSGPPPDVDAILNQIRRRRHRRVALSAGTGVLAFVIAGAMLWPRTEHTGVAGSSSSCQKSAAPDVTRYSPAYVPPGYRDVTSVDAQLSSSAFLIPGSRPSVGVISERTFENWMHFRLNLEVRRVSMVGSFRNSEEASTRRISKGRVSSFVLPCRGRASVWTDDASPGPPSPQGPRRVTYLVLPLDADTEAILRAEPPTADVAGPTVVQLVKVAQSVAVR